MKWTIFRRLFLLIVSVILLSLGFYRRVSPERPGENEDGETVVPVELPWIAPDTDLIPGGEAGRLISYGRELVVNTASYFGPKGSVASLANGLNCQNCHLDAGTRVWGGNFGGVTATFPRFRNRSGTCESIEKKINDCFVRSMNGRGLDTGSHEMQAMIAYMVWLGKDVPEGRHPLGSGLIKVPYPDRAADPVRGKKVYLQKCRQCHGDGGLGLPRHDGAGYIYPPLWGKDSYNTAAGIYRLGKFVSFVKHNMPYGATYTKPQLTDEEAWDVAAYVNSRPRPLKKPAEDWPDITQKPVDHPFGPYADNFSEKQHKYGPFKPIEAARKTLMKIVRNGR